MYKLRIIDRFRQEYYIGIDKDHKLIAGMIPMTLRKAQDAFLIASESTTYDGWLVLAIEKCGE